MNGRQSSTKVPRVTRKAARFCRSLTVPLDTQRSFFLRRIADLIALPSRVLQARTSPWTFWDILLLTKMARNIRRFEEIDNFPARFVERGLSFPEYKSCPKRVENDKTSVVRCLSLDGGISRDGGSDTKAPFSLALSCCFAARPVASPRAAHRVKTRR